MVSRRSKANRQRHEVLSDTRSVWINSAKTGYCLGRFSRWGIDIHAELDSTIEEVRDCVDCTHTMPGIDGWQRFVAGMREHHGVVVGEQHKPKWLEV